MHSCSIFLDVCFEGQIELILLLNVFLCCHTWQLESNNLVTQYTVVHALMVYKLPLDVQWKRFAHLENQLEPVHLLGSVQGETRTLSELCVYCVCMYIHTNDCPRIGILYRDMRLSTKCLMDIGICTRRNQYKWVIHANTSSTDMTLTRQLFQMRCYIRRYSWCK